MSWTDKDMIRFARIASEGAYGLYSGCRSLESKLNRYKKLSKTMSRYIKELDNGKTVAYGFEHENQVGYYIKVYDVEEDNIQHLLFGRASNQGMSNSEMIYLMDIHSLPESHIEQVAMDLPIK